MLGTLRKTFLWRQDFSSLTREVRCANYINGEWKHGSGSGLIVPSNPSEDCSIPLVSGEGIQASSQADVDEAVEVAKRAAKDWSKTTIETRSQVLRDIAAGIRAEAKKLAALESLSCGLRIADAEYSVESSAATFDFFANVLWSSRGQVLPPVLNGAATSTVTMQPLGVCGLITPFNYPLEMGAWKLAPALAAGNSIVWKPPEAAPMSALKFAHVLDSVKSLPAGTVNILHGFGYDCGFSLVRHPEVDCLGFTGSIATGKAIQAAAGTTNLKRCNLELGGNSAGIICDDYDMKKAVNALLPSTFCHSGQSCTSCRRAFVPHGKLDEFLGEAVKFVQERKLGHALDPSVDQGPLISPHSVQRVIDTVNAACKEFGAEVVVGNFKPKFAAGSFLSPTIVLGGSPDAPLIKDELFGPVLCVQPYRDLEEAVATANDTPYGLSSNVFTNSIDRAHWISQELKAGTVWINGADLMNPITPFGGVKLSGYGKDLGELSLASYSYQKTTTFVHGSRH